MFHRMENSEKICVIFDQYIHNIKKNHCCNSENKTSISGQEKRYKYLKNARKFWKKFLYMKGHNMVDNLWKLQKNPMKIREITNVKKSWRIFFGNISLKKWGWGHKNFRINFSHDTKQHRIAKFEIGIWGYLTNVDLLYPLKRMVWPY